MRLSYTSISDFLKCPRLFKLRHIDGRGDVASGRMLEGRGVHEEIAKGKVPEFFSGVFDKNFINPRFEERVEFEFLGYEFVGVIDAYSVSGASCFIVDWKLMSLPDDDLQLKYYAWLLMSSLKASGCTVHYFTGYYVSVEGKFWKRYDFLLDDVVAFEKWLIDVIEEIEKEEFGPKFGDHCKSCPFLAECYNDANIEVAKGVFAIRSVEEAIEYAEKVVLAENFLKVIKERIKEFMLSEGIGELDCGKFKAKLVPSIALRFYSKRGGKK